MAVASILGQYKRAQPSAAMTKEGTSKNETRSKPLGPSHDYQRLKKLNSQQALDNPDWRTRPSDSSGSSTRDDEQKLRALIGAAKQWSEVEASPITPSAVDKGHRRRSYGPQPTTDSSQDGATDSESKHKRRNVYSLSSELEPAIVKTMNEEKPVQYEVLKQICLSSSREHPLSLFEVVPLGTVSGYLSPSVVDIRPLKENVAPRRSYTAQSEHMSAALMVAGNTPNKVRVLPKPPVHKEEAQKKYTTPDRLQQRSKATEQPETSITPNNRSDPRSNERLSPGQTARLVTEGGPAAAAEAERDQAFRRFLRRLVQKNKGLQTEKPQQRTVGYHGNAKEDDRQGSTDTCVLRNRVNGSDGRKEIASTYFMNHQARSSEISPKDKRARLPAGETVKFKDLNPKAREFLSFVNQSPNAGNGSTLAYHPLPPLPTQVAKPVVDKNGQPDAPSLSGSGLPNISPPPGLGLPNVPPHLAIGLPTGSTFQQQQLPPPYGFMPSAAPDTTIESMAFNNSIPGRLVPLPMTTDHSGGPFQAPAIPMPPLPPLLPAMFRPQTVMQNMMGNTSTWGFPPAPMTSAAYPWMGGSISPGFNMPPYQMPSMADIHQPPQPVPKPRRPDPGDQQAYEAWIEWRKANEPGYALECRLRQQRRAQRSMTDRGGSKHTMQKSEASAAS
ncbi:uncharacterized protein TRIREDRAFT_108557 [Trichoderma reesei QM6a]|jgi:hypothetical protein|uniref:Predicted protein n=2 Tax=Hypocrea jecorina TaxID=51453 RepID=G0RLW1_HYPJQ|nr:uncharacterized protein TRIREDRAFT_108557 [Trichoderma reesei QM6a]EGR47811.1 predicted protein [Trichoderma reesei QM6a]ETS01142.1 hypothetical protein M419DRAFT_81526 [Trichoderma reesei RUT C-30]